MMKNNEWRNGELTAGPFKLALSVTGEKVRGENKNRKHRVSFY